MDQTTLQRCLDAALRAAAESADLIRGYYRGDIQVELKADQSPVTVADRATERLIREQLLEQFPDHAFYGEEYGQAGAESEWLWLVDPIDGTKSFIAGYGMFSTQIALQFRDELVLGVSSAPAHDELAWAARGIGVEVNTQPGRIRDPGDIRQAAISTGNIQSLARSSRWPLLGKVLAQANRTRGYGDYYHYHRLAAGQIDAVIESDVNILDIAALAVIVRQAGGVFTDLDGNAPGMNTTSVLAAGPELHRTLLRQLNPGAQD